MKTRIFLILLFLLATGCGQYAQESVQNVYIKPGQMFTAERGKHYILIPGRPLDWSNVYPPPEVVYMKGGQKLDLKPGRKYVEVWEDNMLNKDPVCLYPGQSFVFDDNKVYFLFPGPLIDSSKEDPKPEVMICEPNLRSKLIEGRKYALLPRPEDSWQYIVQQTPMQLTQQTPASTPQAPYVQNYNPNEQHIYVHTDDDDFVGDMYLLNEMRRQSMNDYFDRSRRTMDSMEDSILKMRGSTMGTLGILDNARMQQEAYQRQKDAEMRRAYGR